MQFKSSSTDNCKCIQLSNDESQNRNIYSEFLFTSLSTPCVTDDFRVLPATAYRWPPPSYTNVTFVAVLLVRYFLSHMQILRHFMD